MSPEKNPESQVTASAEADVVVVGLGVAGAAAAIGAAEEGADVLVVERTTGGGGSSAQSAGYVYLGGGTHSQIANGFRDSAENMLAFLKALNPSAAVDKLEAYAYGSVAHMSWLESMGVLFNDRFYVEKHIMHTSDETLAWTGSEDAWPYLEAAAPAPRGHKVEGIAAGGPILVARLFDRCRALGVRFHFDSRVSELLRDRAGAVIGVRYRASGIDFDVKARRAVVLATGGFEWNRELVEQFAPELAIDGVEPLGAPTADGSGVILGLSASARLSNMGGFDIASAWYPPQGLIRGILVNQGGRRFINEDVYHGRSALAVLRQPEKRAYLVCDNRIFDYPKSHMGHRLIDAWESVPEMEVALGMPTGSLQETIANYNRCAARGDDPEFHKQPRWLAPIEESPFAAIDCSLGAAQFSMLSMGGLDTALDGEVLGEHGQPIHGLFAAGVLAPSIALNGADYASGMLLGSGTFFGRRAGKAAALCC